LFHGKRYLLIRYRAQKIYEFIKGKVFWNSLLRYGIQSYLKMAVLALTQSLSLEFFKEKGNTINSFLCILIIFFLVGYPFFTFFFMRKNQSKL
jgi:hypothetical protein